MPYKVTLTGSSRQFNAEPDETLLNSAGHAGLALPWRCMDGSCGSCRAHLLCGECILPDGTRLKADDNAQSVLMCQTLPRSNLELAPVGIRSVEDVACRAFDLELEEKSSLSPHVIQLKLKVLGDKPLHWLPGQYLELLLSDGQRRAFSIANASDGGNHIELHVRHVAEGSFSRWVFESFEVGMRLRAEGPLGTFVPRENSERGLLFIAGGTGIAPIKAMIEHFAALGSQRPMQLYWGTRQPGEMYLGELIDAWTQDIPQLAFVLAVSDPDVALEAGVRRGMVLDVVLADHPQLVRFDVYVCGPPVMVDAAIHAFAATDLPKAQLFFDSYEYAPDLLANILGQRAGIHAG